MIIFLTYETKISTYSIHNSSISHFLLHASVVTCHRNAGYTPIYLKHNKIYFYNSSIHYVIVIPVATFLGCKIQYL
jgi:hypothetical protein